VHFFKWKPAITGHQFDQMFYFFSMELLLGYLKAFPLEMGGRMSKIT